MGRLKRKKRERKDVPIIRRPASDLNPGDKIVLWESDINDDGTMSVKDESRMVQKVYTILKKYKHFYLTERNGIRTCFSEWEISCRRSAL